MKTFNDLDFNVHPAGDGVQARIQFENGYGASVVRNAFSYGNEGGLFELAVFDSTGEITYRTPITQDVLGYLTEEDVTTTLKLIQELPVNDPRLFEDGLLAN